MELKLSSACSSSPIPVKLEISFNKCSKVMPGFLDSGYNTKEVGTGLLNVFIVLLLILKHQV